MLAVCCIDAGSTRQVWPVEHVVDRAVTTARRATPRRRRPLRVNGEPIGGWNGARRRRRRVAGTAGLTPIAVVRRHREAVARPVDEAVHRRSAARPAGRREGAAGRAAGPSRRRDSPRSVAPPSNLGARHVDESRRRRLARTADRRAPATARPSSRPRRRRPWPVAPTAVHECHRRARHRAERGDGWAARCQRLGGRARRGRRRCRGAELVAPRRAVGQDLAADRDAEPLGAARHAVDRAMARTEGAGRTPAPRSVRTASDDGGVPGPPLAAAHRHAPRRPSRSSPRRARRSPHRWTSTPSTSSRPSCPSPTRRSRRADASLPTATHADGRAAAHRPQPPAPRGVGHQRGGPRPRPRGAPSRADGDDPLRGGVDADRDAGGPRRDSSPRRARRRRQPSADER